MNKIILFDMDGTLINSTEAIYESFCYVLNKYSKSIPHINDLSKFIGYRLEDMFKFFNVEDKDINKYCDEYKQHYINIADSKTNILENAIESIKIAHEFALLGIVTTKSSKSSKKILSKFGICEHFITIIGREDVTYVKPHKEPILKAIENINNSCNKKISLNNIFMIGDTTLDLKAAKNANINGVGVLCGYGVKKDLLEFSNLIFKDTFDAINAIKGL